MTVRFDSFCESPVGGFIESPLGVRGCEVLGPPPTLCRWPLGFTVVFPSTISGTWPPRSVRLGDLAYQRNCLGPPFSSGSSSLLPGVSTFADFNITIPPVGPTSERYWNKSISGYPYGYYVRLSRLASTGIITFTAGHSASFVASHFFPPHVCGPGIPPEPGACRESGANISFVWRKEFPPCEGELLIPEGVFMADPVPAIGITTASGSATVTPSYEQRPPGDEFNDLGYVVPRYSGGTSCPT